jgi:hypothetical protein
MSLILIWALIGALAWIVSILREGRLEVGDLVFLPLCCLMGPLVIFLSVFLEIATSQTVIWKRKK